METKSAAEVFAELVRIMKDLRTPETGCPWDLEQDHLSLRPYLIEETYEVLHAIEGGGDKELCDELGDLLLQVVLHAQVAQDREAFSIVDVVQQISEKMVRRHPHVFGDVEADSSAKVLKNWEAIKAKEGQDRVSTAERLAKIPLTLPALLRAQRLGEKAGRVHFDWESLDGVLDKVREEVGELESELSALAAKSIKEPGRNLNDQQRKRIEHELGDVLFSLCQLSRWLGISAEDSLRTATSRFTDRFRRMEEAAGGNIASLPPAELDKIWENVKKSGD